MYKYNMYVKINVLLLCAWPFKLDVGDWGISVLVNLRTQLISYCWYYELQIKKFTYEISAYDTLEKSAGFLNIDFNQSSFWLINNLTINDYFILHANMSIYLEKKVVSNFSNIG